MKDSGILALLAIFSSCFCFDAVPLVVASHKLAKGLKDELSGNNLKPYKVDEATNMIKKLVTQCSSDEYLIINQPGLRLNDITDIEKEHWPHFYKYLTLSSTVVGLPWVEEPIDLDYLEKYILKTCKAETISVDHEDEREVNYIDSKTRVIRIELSELPENLDERRDEMRKHDLLIRQILRKLPSPHYTIIFTATTTQDYHPLPRAAIEHSPKRFNVFDSITNDPLRKDEVERNDRFHRPPMNSHRGVNAMHKNVENRKKNEVHLFSRKTWENNEKLIATVVVTATAIFMQNVYMTVMNRVREKKIKNA